MTFEIRFVVANLNGTDQACRATECMRRELLNVFVGTEMVSVEVQEVKKVDFAGFQEREKEWRRPS